MKISLEKPPLNELTQSGILGMKWGIRREQKLKRQEQKADADFKRRSKVINRIKNQGEGKETDLGTMYVMRGDKAVNRILDLMSKNPKRSLTSASLQQLGETVAKRVLITAGALSVGAALSKFVRTYGTG